MDFGVKNPSCAWWDTSACSKALGSFETCLHAISYGCRDGRCQQSSMEIRQAVQNWRAEVPLVVDHFQTSNIWIHAPGTARQMTALPKWANSPLLLSPSRPLLPLIPSWAAPPVNVPSGRVYTGCGTHFGHGVKLSEVFYSVLFFIMPLRRPELQCD